MAVVMEKALITEASLTDAANAIRSKLGVSDTYYPSEMGDAIRSIKTLAAEVRGTTLYLTGNGVSVSGTTLSVEDNLHG